MELIRVFAGFDRREELGYHAFCSSVMQNTSWPVSFTPLVKESLAVAGAEVADGSNAFTYSRFLVPWLCDFKGWAIFVDAVDMVVVGDLARLWELRDPKMQVQVVKHDYRTKHVRKYVGTKMECDNRDYDRKQWASVMLMNCGAWEGMTPQVVNQFKPLDLLQMKFMHDKFIGDLPVEWNWIADEHGKNDRAQLLHFTAGPPIIPAYSTGAHADEWFRHATRAISCSA